jgi:hypothetical protein
MKGTGGPQSASFVRAAILLLLFLFRTASAVAAQDVLDVDLSPLIDQSAQYPTRFAVDVPHRVSIASGGSWTQNGTSSTWTYSIRIPTAVSMSFHSASVNLPADAVLTVTGTNGVNTTYRARDIARSGLWSRPLPGDSLLLSLSLRTAERATATLQIESFQAGYRGLSGSVPDNAHYRAIREKDTQTSTCTVNYSCAATSANQGPAHATVAVVVGNVIQCTGTLINDTSGDGIPYVLTARHCENGTLGGGDPGAAANITIYWDAVTPCDATLGSIYDGTAITQSGAATVAEQQDAWLIQLDTSPAASDAYFAGWDATGGVFSGGYSIHHALGYNQQYVDWYGQPILQTIPGATLNLGYSSTFWGVVNSNGSVGAGASGGAFFDSNNKAVGSLTLGQLINGANSAGVCPVTPTPTPSPSTVTAQYTALSGVFSSTADTTSTTATTTLQSVLDAAKTGQLSVNGAAFLPVTLTVDHSSPLTGQTLNLSWSAPGAQACTATGGLSGDGWSGSQSANGTYGLTEGSGGQVTYSIRCTAANQIGSASVTVSWQFVPASVNLSGPTTTVNAGSAAVLQWSASTQPCTASGGISGDGWAGAKASTGSQSVLASVLGNTTYMLTCGSGNRTATGQYTITVVAPYVSQITGDADQMRVGQTVNLLFGAGGSCVASGGAPGDGWAGPLGTQYAITETTAGTYTYTVTCTGAGATANLSATNSVTLTFTNAPPTASLSATPTPVEVSTDPGALASVLNLSWTSNVRPCGISYVGPGNVQGTVTGLDEGMPTGTGVDDEQVAGAYVYTVTCGTGQNQAQASTPVTWFTNAPAVTLNVSNPWPAGTPWMIGWQSNVFPCTGTGGQSGDGWAGGPKTGALGSQTLTESTPGSVTFGITCGSGSQTAQAQASTTVATPTAAITASATTLPVSSALLIRWTSNFDSCTSSISPGTGNWGTVLSGTGTFQTTQLVAGTYTYTILCDGGQASVPVTFTGSLLTFGASSQSVAVNTPVTLSWNSSFMGYSCMASGGSAGDGWTGSLAGIGTQTVTSVNTGTVTYGMTCNLGSGWSQAPQAQTQVTYTSVEASQPAAPTPTATLTANASSEVVGNPVTLSWTSKNASACTASGGASGDGWSGSLSLSGTMSITESTAGSFGYSLVCTGAPPAASAEAEVEFTAASVTVTGSSGGTGSSGSGKSGGGGALDPWCILLLGLLLATRRRDRYGCRRWLTPLGNSISSSTFPSGSINVAFFTGVPPIWIEATSPFIVAPAAFAAATAAPISDTWKIACVIGSLAARGSRRCRRNSGDVPALAAATVAP